MYILDALKKSEKKRMQGTVPDVLTAQEVVYREPKTRRLWPYFIVAALIVNALAVVLFVPHKSKKADTVLGPGAAVTKVASKERDAISVNGEKTLPDSAVNIQGVTDSAKPAERKPAHDLDETPRHQLAAAKDEVREKTTIVRKSETGAKVIHETTPESPPETPAATAPPEPKPPVDITPIPNKVYSVSELPLSIQQKLPSFGISVFLYSDDTSSRMVKINNKMLKEGDYLSEGLKLEEIDQNSLILNYQNFRFRIGLK